MDLSRFPRRRYSQGPSPLEFLPNFTRALGGPRVWIKRDDMLGLAPGGNKTRKLEFLVGDALAKGADTLITCGAPQSNHCRITLSAAVKEGLKCRFVIEERIPGSYKVDATGNNFMFRLMGVESITVVPAGTNMAEAMDKAADEVRALGRIPIVGIGVSRDPSDQDPLVLKEAQATLDLLGVDLKVPREAVVSHGDWWRPKYSVPNPAMIEAVQMLARTEAILLDPVYTGKIMAGLIGLSRKGYFKPTDNVLFLHTGGATALHAYESVVLGDPQAAA